jgi:hypothetical protein
MSHDPEIALLLDMLDRAFDRKSWHGTNLRGSIRGLSADQAAWRPAPGRHNAWEIVVHAAYWKYVVRRRFRPEARGSFPLRGSNWFVRPTAGLDADAVWREDLALLADQHRRLREAVASLTSAELHAPPPSPSTTSNLALVEGAAAHDLYHAGQIQLLKRLCGAGT